jgi:hypothetical protein
MSPSPESSPARLLESLACWSHTASRYGEQVKGEEGHTMLSKSQILSTKAQKMINDKAKMPNQ